MLWHYGSITLLNEDIVATIAEDESDVDVDEDISNTVIISASEALRYAKGLKAYIQQQNEIEVYPS